MSGFSTTAAPCILW